MRPRPGAPTAAPPLPPVSRGDRTCDACDGETTHTATRVISGFGRRMIIGAVLLVIVMEAYFFSRAGLAQPAAWIGTSALTLVAGALIAFVGTRRTEYRLVCEQCGKATTRLSPPHWTRRRGPRRESPDRVEIAQS